MFKSHWVHHKMVVEILQLSLQKQRKLFSQLCISLMGAGVNVLNSLNKIKEIVLCLKLTISLIFLHTGLVLMHLKNFSVVVRREVKEIKFLISFTTCMRE